MVNCVDGSWNSKVLVVKRRREEVVGVTTE